MKFKKTFVALITILIAIGFLVYKAENVVPPTMEFSHFGCSTTFFFFKGDISYENKATTNQFCKINKEKTLRKISKSEEKKAHFITSFAYGNDKGRIVGIDDEGRVFFMVDPSEIRNKSRLGWLWWKLSDKQVFYYCTDPDPKVAEIAKQIENDLRNK